MGFVQCCVLERMNSNSQIARRIKCHCLQLFFLFFCSELVVMESLVRGSSWISAGCAEATGWPVTRCQASSPVEIYRTATAQWPPYPEEPATSTSRRWCQAKTTSVSNVNLVFLLPYFLKFERNFLKTSPFCDATDTSCDFWWFFVMGLNVLLAYFMSEVKLEEAFSQLFMEEWFCTIYKFSRSSTNYKKTWINMKKLVFTLLSVLLTNDNSLFMWKRFKLNASCHFGNFLPVQEPHV